ncbi:MAG: hypothetical protein ABWX84_09095 [Nocardioides sp.]
MNTLRKSTAALGITALLAVPAALVTASPANADNERGGSCGGARFELNVDRENGGFEIDADVDNAAPGSRWRIVLKHDGKTYYNKVRTTDNEGDVDVERFRKNTAGKDRFGLRVKNVRTGKVCRTSIVTS